MIRSLAFACCASSAWAGGDLPSGLTAAAHDVLVETQPTGEAWLVLRYVAPAIAGGAVDYGAVVPDLDHLCATDGLSQVSEAEAEIAQVMIVLMDRPVDRGAPDVQATQYIGAYVPSGEGCLWQ